MKINDKSYLRLAISLVALWLISAVSPAQQVPMYSQYIMNGFLVNPSFAGQEGYTAFNLTVREQWVGLPQAPSTYALSFQTRILKDSYISKATVVRRKLVRPTRGGRVGLGGYVFNDQNGIMRRTGIQAHYAYHIPMGQTSDFNNNLSFGLALTAYQYAIDTDGLIYDYNDPYLNNYDRSVFIPDFNFGVSYSTPRYYVGFAMTNLMRGSVLFTSGSASNMRSELGHYFLTGGFKIRLGGNWDLAPSGYLKMSDMLLESLQADLTTRLFYRDDYWAGVSYRTNDAVIMMIGLKYDRFWFAYAFDFTLTDIRSQSLGSHELTLALKFGESARRYRWINAY